MIALRTRSASTALIALVAASFAIPPQAVFARPDPTPPADNAATTLRFDATPGAVARELRREAHDALVTENPAGTSGAPASGDAPANGNVPEGEGNKPKPGMLRTAAGMTFDPVFIGAIGLEQLADAGIHHDPDRVGDLAHELDTPDFYAGVGIFNATYRGADAVASRVGAGIAKSSLGAAAGETGVLASGGKLLRENVVLAAALTIPKLVQVDFGGFTFKDALHGDFRKLKDASVHMGHVDAESTGITLGSFMLAQPVWAGIKFAVKTAAKKLAIRAAAAAGVEVAALTVPVGGEIFDAVVTVGEVAWFAVDLAGLLMTAHAIEQPVQNWNDSRRFENATTDAVQKLMQVSQENGGNPNPADFKKALAGTMESFRNLRDLHYLNAAVDDAQFVNRVERAGNGDRQAAMKTRLTGLSGQVQSDYGRDLSAIAQTVVLKRSFDGTTAAGEPDQDQKDPYGRYRSKVASDVRAIYAAPTLAPERLDPTARDFALSENRSQLYDQEQVVYARARVMIKDPALQKQLADEIALVGAIKNVDTRLEQEAIGETPAADTDPGRIAAANGGAGSNGSAGSSSTDNGPSKTDGINGSLKKHLND